MNKTALVKAAEALADISFDYGDAISANNRGPTLAAHRVIHVASALSVFRHGDHCQWATYTDLARKVVLERVNK